MLAGKATWDIHLWPQTAMVGLCGCCADSGDFGSGWTELRVGVSLPRRSREHGNNARDLVAAGWHEGRRLGPALRCARDLESSGLSRLDELIWLEQEFPKQVAVILPC